MTDKNAKLRLRVPKGFYNLMEAFVRDILKNKPLDVFAYGVTYFENLLQVRTDTGHDPSVHGATSVATCGNHGHKSKRKHLQSMFTK